MDVSIQELLKGSVLYITPNPDPKLISLLVVDIKTLLVDAEKRKLSFE